MVDLEAYVAFLKSCGNLFDYCINLDTDPEITTSGTGTWARLKQEGFNVLPVVHDPYAGEIDQLYGQGHRYILIAHPTAMTGNSWTSSLIVIFTAGSFRISDSISWAPRPMPPSRSTPSIQRQRHLCPCGGFGDVLFWNEYREPNPNGDRTDYIYLGVEVESLSKGPPMMNIPLSGSLRITSGDFRILPGWSQGSLGGCPAVDCQCQVYFGPPGSATILHGD